MKGVPLSCQGLGSGSDRIWCFCLDPDQILSTKVCRKHSKSNLLGKNKNEKGNNNLMGHPVGIVTRIVHWRASHSLPTTV